MVYIYILKLLRKKGFFFLKNSRVSDLEVSLGDETICACSNQNFVKSMRGY